MSFILLPGLSLIFLKQMLVICPLSLLCVSLHSYEAVVIMFHLHSPPTVFVCVCAALVFQPIPLSSREIGFL